MSKDYGIKMLSELLKHIESLPEPTMEERIEEQKIFDEVINNNGYSLNCFFTNDIRPLSIVEQIYFDEDFSDEIFEITFEATTNIELKEDISITNAA